MRFLTFSLIFLSFFTSVSQDYKFGTIPEALLSNADAVVRFDQMNAVVTARDQMEISSKRVVTVLNENGDEFIHAFSFYDKGDRIGELEAKIYNKQGKEVKKIKKKDFIDQSAVPGGTLYSDSRVLFMRYTPTEYPYTVEFTKEYVTDNTAFAPPWYFLDGYRVSTQISDFSFSVECGIPFRHKGINLEAYSIESKVTNSKVSYYGTNLSAIEEEPLSPPFRELAPHIKLALDEFHLEGVDGQGRNWEELGKWIYDDLLVGQGEIDDQTIQQVKELVRNINDPKEKIKRVYEFVQDNTRYISVQLGIGGWMPISASEVDRVKYGDCKGLTNYTMALLNAVGIESYYTVVFAGRKKRDFDPDFPSMQGNHAFLNVPLEEDEVWLECTSQITPVNHLGTFTDNRNVLKVTPSGGELVKTKTYKNEENYQHTGAEFFTDANGQIRGQVRILSQGIQYNQKFRHPLKSKLEQEEYYKKYWGYINNLSLAKIGFTNDKDNIEFVEEVEIVIEDYLSHTDGKLFLAPNLANRNLAVPDRSRNRKTDVVIARGYLDEDEFIIHLPEGYKPETLINPVKLDTKFGTYEIDVKEKEPGTLIYQRRLLIKSGRYSKEEYKPYRDFRKKIARYDNSRIILTQK